MSDGRIMERILLLLLAIVLVILAGPGILLPYPLQRWAAAQYWNASGWQHLAWFGPASLNNWWLRSFLMLFLF